MTGDADRAQARRALVEFVAGPACGQTRMSLTDGVGNPPVELRVAVPAKWRSALDDHPSVPASTHLYHRGEMTPTPAGPVWRYRHHGQIPE